MFWLNVKATEKYQMNYKLQITSLSQRFVIILLHMAQEHRCIYYHL